MADVANWEVASIDTSGNILTDGEITAGGTIRSSSFAGPSGGTATLSGSLTLTPLGAASSDGELSTTAYSSYSLNSTSATCNVTLAAGSYGKIIALYVIGYTNAITVTSDFGSGLTTLTFSDVGEGALLMYGNEGSAAGAWFVIGNNGGVLS
jgi:hypothetical protein